MNSMMNAGGRKLGRTTSSGFGQARTVFRANFGDSRIVKTSSRRDLSCRKTLVEQSDNRVDMLLRERLDDGGDLD